MARKVYRKGESRRITKDRKSSQPPKTPDPVITGMKFIRNIPPLEWVHDMRQVDPENWPEITGMGYVTDLSEDDNNTDEIEPEDQELIRTIIAQSLSPQMEYTPYKPPTQISDLQRSY